MKPQRIVIGLVALAILFLAWRLLAPQFRPAPVLSGYIEAETLFLSAPTAGTVTSLSVRRGQRVGAGAPLFTIQPNQRIAQSEAAAAEMEAALADAEDARKGERPVELGILEAEVSAAEAVAREAKANLGRVSSLAAKGIFAKARLDDARNQSQSADARVAAARRRLEAATLGDRSDRVRAADARASRARAVVSETGARLEDMAPSAPAAGRIEDVFFQRGEWASANQPVVALIPDDRVYVRFFVPETEASAYQVGRRVRFACDGCPDDLAATIVYVSPRPEFTPPVIYSREARDRLVFMVEARPTNGARLVPGLPVDVTPL